MKGQTRPERLASKLQVNLPDYLDGLVVLS
jgi:hypothetical protein